MVTINENHEFHTIDGKSLAEKILFDLRKKIIKENLHPGLAVILVGNDPSSRLYVKNKENASKKVGIDFHKYLCGNEFFPNISENEIITMVEFLNNDPTISSIIIQLPLPKQFNTQKIIEAIDPRKDVDGFHPHNIKKILSQRTENLPPLIKTIFYILKSIAMNVEGKRVCVLSRSDIFRQVIVKALEDRGANVNATTLEGTDAKEILKKADIVISILGKPKIITGEMIKKDATIIDIGITKTENGFFGDADFESIKKVAKFATPTPGGVGPVTVAMLLDSVFELSKNKREKPAQGWSALGRNVKP